MIQHELVWNQYDKFNQTHFRHRSSQFMSDFLPSTRSSSWKFTHQPAEEAELVLCPVKGLRTQRQIHHPGVTPVVYYSLVWGLMTIIRVQESILSVALLNWSLTSNLLLGSPAVLQPVVHLVFDFLNRCALVIALIVQVFWGFVNWKLHLWLLHLRPLLPLEDEQK